MNVTRKSFFSGLLYTASAKYSNVIITIIIGSVLARLLTPEEFGIVAVVTVFVTFFNLLGDFGLGPAVIQNQNLNKSDIQSIYSFAILLGITLALTFYSLGGVISNFYDNSELSRITHYLSVSIFFYIAQIIPKALITKQLEFKKIGLITVLVQIIGGIIAIVMALKGFSYYSLVIRSIVISFLTFLIFFIYSPLKVSFSISKNSLFKVAKFSINQFLFNIINYFSRNSDNILIGKYLGTAPLGYYEKSYQLMMMPIQNLTHVITPVLLPIFSKTKQALTDILTSYNKLVCVLSLIGFPLAIFLHFTSGELILIIFGKQWHNSISVFKILSLSVGFQIVSSSSGAIYQSTNRTDLLLFSGIFSAFVMVTGISVGVFLFGTISMVANILVCAFALNFIQSFFILYKFALKDKFINFLNLIKKPFLIGLILYIIFYIFNIFVILPLLYSLIVKVIFFTCSYLILVLVFMKEDPVIGGEFKSLLAKVKKT